MNEQSFCLQPFPSASFLPHLQITGSIARRSNRLAIRYALRGHLAGFMIPQPGSRDPVFEIRVDPQFAFCYS